MQGHRFRQEYSLGCGFMAMAAVRAVVGFATGRQRKTAAYFPPVENTSANRILATLKHGGGPADGGERHLIVAVTELKRFAFYLIERKIDISGRRPCFSIAAVAACRDTDKLSESPLESRSWPISVSLSRV